MSRRSGGPTAPPGKVLRYPGILRLLHWSHVTLGTVMILSGFYLDRPFLPPHILRVSRVRLVHSTSASPYVASFVLYLVYLLSSGAWRDLVPGPADWRALGGTIRYELLLSEEMPMHGKYHILQKLLYLSIIIAIPVKAATGWALASHGTWSGSLIIRLAGGLQGVRLVHFFVSLFLLIGVTLHFYRVVSEPGSLGAMLTGWAPAVPPPGTKPEKATRPPELR